jgi:hypothetical protein
MTAVLMFIVILYMKAMTSDDIKRLTAKKNCPSMYTVMLQNVPNVSDDSLKSWISLRLGASPVELNWAYDVNKNKIRKLC